MKRYTYTVVYDIPSDARRIRIANVLKSFGERVQYSVFECVLARSELSELESELGKRMDTDQDSIRIYRIDGDVRCLGTATAHHPDDFIMV